MRKFLAAAILASLSASALAAPVTWTGTLSNAKITYMPAGAGLGSPVLQLKNVGTVCSGTILLDANDADAADIRQTVDVLNQAKAAVATVTLTYEQISTYVCRLSSVTR